MKKRAKRKGPATDAWAWLPKPRAAEAAGYSVRQFTDKIQPRLDAAAVRGKGATMRFDVRAVVKALAAYVADQWRPKLDDPDGLLDPSTPTGKDPTLDALRIESTIKLRLDNATKRGELIDRQRMQTALVAGFSAAATAGKQLELRFGRDGAELWNKGIKAMQRAAVAALGEGEKASAPGDG